jgi:hypothetical protein
MTDDDRTNAMLDAIRMFLHPEAASAMLLVKSILFRYLHMIPKKLHD